MLKIRLLTLLAALPLRMWVLLQRLRGKITQDAARNHLGFATKQKPDGPLIWIHAASLGELSAVRPFLSHLVRTYPDYCLLVTTNNPSALNVAARWPDIPAILQAAPLDLPAVLNRFLDHWNPVAFVNIETEIWPNRFAALAARDIPAIGLNARLSDTSAKRLAKLGPAIGLQHFAAIFAQSTDSADNFRALLGPDVHVEPVPNFKSMVTLPATDPILAQRFIREKTILAASTHEGEDAVLLAAFAKCAKTDPALTMIIAPRHPQRASNIAKIAVEMGLSPKSMDAPEPGNLFIVETLGQLPQLYGLAAVTCVGGSFMPDIGGHTPYEPIRANSAIITGPFTHNFATEYHALHAADGCIVTPEDTLAASLSRALIDPDHFAKNAAIALPISTEPELLFAKITANLGLSS